MNNYKYEYLIKNSGNTIIRGGGDKFSIGDEVFTHSYEKRVIKSFNIDEDYGGIRVDWAEGGHSSLGSIHKTDSEHKLYLAKELLRHNDCSIKYETPGGFHLEGSIHTMRGSVSFYGTPDVMIHGEGYIPLKQYLDHINKAYKGEQKPSEDEIIKAKELVKQNDGQVIDYRKKWRDDDMEKCYQKSGDGTFEDYINSL